MLAPGIRQSAELLRRAVGLYDALGTPVPPVRQTTLALELANRSRVVSLPANPDTIRGFTPSLVIVDEASRVADPLFRAIRPMLAVSNGRMVLASTPNGRTGFFFESWQGRGRWERVKVTAPECARIDADFLAEELATLGERYYRQEYMCEFHDAEGQVFPQEVIEAMFA
jgi:hypothetical protein